MNKNCKIIGIAGGTGSGKTALAESLSLEFPKSNALIIEQDSYYKDLSNLKIIVSSDRLSTAKTG